MMEKIRNIFRKRLSLTGIPIQPSVLSNLVDYFNMLIDMNLRINLVGPMDDDKIIDYLFIDSLLFLKHFPIESSVKIADIGTGAGFPGLVIEIARPDIHITFIDSSKKKLNFVKRVCTDLSIDNVTFYPGRVEEAGRSREHREKYDFVLSRAMADLPVLVELSAPLLKTGGKLVAWKGKKYPEEMKILGTAYKIVGLDVGDVYSLRSREEDWSSYLVCFRKIRGTPERFPRSFQAIKRKSLELLNK